MNTKVLSAAVLVVLTLSWTPAWAEDVRKRPAPTWKMGGGLVHVSQPYRGMDGRSIPIPFISYRGKNFFFQGPQAGVKTTLYHVLVLGTQVRYHFGGYDPEDSSFFTGMNKRKDTFEVGGLVEIRMPYRVGLKLDYFRDTLGRHHGQEWKLTLSRPFRRNKWMLIPSGGMTFLSANKADYYYGIEPAEARLTRRAIEIPGAENPTASLTVIYKLTQHWSSMLLFSHTWLDSAIQKSALIDENRQISAILGLSTHF